MEVPWPSSFSCTALAASGASGLLIGGRGAQCSPVHTLDLRMPTTREATHSEVRTGTEPGDRNALSGHPSDSWTRAAGRQGRSGCKAYESFKKARITLCKVLAASSCFSAQLLGQQAPPSRDRNPTQHNFEGSVLCKLPCAPALVREGTCFSRPGIREGGSDLLQTCEV